MKIGLMGFECESANKGCEALSYAFVNFLNRNYKELEVYVWGTNLGKIPELFPKIKFFHVVPKLKDIKLAFIRLLKKLDFIFDVTMGDSFSDIYSKEYCAGLIQGKRIAELFNKNYVLMPQTYGPFCDKSIRNKAKKVISKARYVISRDHSSIEYLKSIGIQREILENIDLAFMLPFDSKMYLFDRPRKKLGINISGLLWKGGFHSNNQFKLTLDYREYVRSIIKTCLSKNEWDVYLIPHVIDLRDNAYDDDYHVLKQLHDEFPLTILAPAFDTPIQAKSYISNMDCFIGSRMHSTIGAFSSGVAVIPVSYSRKFEGLYNTLDYKYLIHGTEYSTSKAVELTLKYIDSYYDLRNVVKEKKSIIDDKINSLENRLKGLIG